jgi:molecular chaperone Hsp33
VNHDVTGSEGPHATAPDDDQVLPFRLDALGVRGRAVRLGPLLDAVLSRHDYPEAVAALLGEAMVLAATLASALKYDGIFTLQLRGDGPVRLVVTDITSDGDVRGYAQYDAAQVNSALAGRSESALDGVVPHLCGKGSMAFTVDQGPGTERYQGVVALEGATLADCAHHYFRMSEQIETGIKLAVERVDSGERTQWRAAGLMVQQMPSTEVHADIDADEREERWRKAVVLLGSARAEEMLAATLPTERLLFRLFHEDGVRVFRRRRLGDRCRCSRARVDSVLRAIPRAELEDLRVPETGDVVVTCEFCSRSYAYTDAEIAALFADATRH